MKKINDINFLRENMMGPNCVMILEELSKDFSLSPNARVLDLGCGKGLTSIFLAEEFGVQVYATDLWITATENFNRFRELGLEDRIIPIHADVHDLPYADGYFDAIICIDSYPYYGAKEGFVGRYLSPLVKKGGFIAVATPGLQKDLKDGIVPSELVPFWEEDMNFYSLDWWKKLWSNEDTITITHGKSMSCHQQAWEDWLQCDNPYAVRDIDMMKAENGKYFDTIEIIATVK
jgi:cyclopropane fatty-acyl-phospholipid synthase-like methyltransferase